jgi:anti-sigma B factor antagonist
MANELKIIRKKPARADDIVIFKPVGFLDAHTFENMEREIKKLFQNEKIFKVVIDLSGLKYISSAGAGVFIGAIGTARDFGGDIVLLSPTMNVREVFDLLGLSTIFSIVDTEEEAVKCFENAGQ